MGMDPALKAKLQKQRYHIVGEHGGVKTCHWTKESLLRDRACYRAPSTVSRAIRVCKCHPSWINAISPVPIVGENPIWIPLS